MTIPRLFLELREFQSRIIVYLKGENEAVNYSYVYILGIGTLGNLVVKVACEEMGRIARSELLVLLRVNTEESSPFPGVSH